MGRPVSFPIASMRTLLVLLTALVALPAAAQNNVVAVGGHRMLPSRNIVDNAADSNIHTTLVEAVGAAELGGELSGPGPFTLFAPTNDAFENLPAGALERALRPANQEALSDMLLYHVVRGRLTLRNLTEQIEAGGGRAALTTIAGGTITATLNGAHNVLLTDERGGTANISVYDVQQSNGFIHVIDAVLMAE